MCPCKATAVPNDRQTGAGMTLYIQYPGYIDISRIFLAVLPPNLQYGATVVPPIYDPSDQRPVFAIDGRNLYYSYP